MRTIIFTEQSGERVIISAAENSECKSSGLNAQVVLPETFFLDLPSDLLMELVTAHDESHEEKYILTRESGISGTEQSVKRHQYKDHLKQIQGLMKVEPERQVEKESQLENRFKLFISAPLVVTGEVLKAACDKMKMKNPIYVAYGTMPGQSARLFIGRDMKAVNDMLTFQRSKVVGAYELNNYNKWEWYCTNDIKSLLQYIFGLASDKNVLNQVKFRDAKDVLIKFVASYVAPVLFASGSSSLLANSIPVQNSPDAENEFVHSEPKRLRLENIRVEPRENRGGSNSLTR